MSVPTSSPSDNSNYNCANGKVRIFIRSPTTPSPEGFSVLINLDSSVLALKQAIFETHPQKPIVRDQKLIYRGRVLNDTDTIVNVLRNGLETDQTFHLVVKPSFQAIAETTGIPISPPSSSSQSIRIPQENTSNITNPQINIQNQNQNYGPNGFVDFVHQIPYVYTPPNFAQYPYVVPSENAHTAQTQQQFPNNMQQQLHIPMSHNFFPMGQYYYVMINGIPYIAQYPYPYPYPYSYQYIITPQIGTQAQQPFAGQIPDPQQDVAARNQRRAATLWLIVKLFFLVYIFSQNASAERMILLYIFALVIFLYQTGRLRIVRRRRQRIIVPMPNELFAQQQQQQQQAPTVQDQEAQSPTQSDQNNNDPSTSSTSSQSSSSPVLNDNSNNNASSSSSQQQNVNDNNGNNSANEAQPNPQENIRSITWQDIEHAIWTFFTSLIPTNPPDVGQQDEVGM